MKVVTNLWNDFFFAVGAPTKGLTPAVTQFCLLGCSIGFTVVRSVVTAGFCHNFVLVIFQYGMSSLGVVLCWTSGLRLRP